MCTAGRHLVGAELAEFIVDLTYDDLPTAVVEQAKWLILDLLA